VFDVFVLVVGFVLFHGWVIEDCSFINNPATEQHESNHKHENIKHQKGTLPKPTLHVNINVTTNTTASSTMHECTP
jgi:hypothetical protein